MLVSQWDALRRLPTVEPSRKKFAARGDAGLKARTVAGVILPDGENSSPLVIPAKNKAVKGAMKSFNWVSYFDQVSESLHAPSYK